MGESVDISKELMPIVEEIYTRVNESSGGVTKYTLFAKLINRGSLLGELYLNTNNERCILTDDGNYLDEIAGDGIYTAYQLINKHVANHIEGNVEVIYNDDIDGVGSPDFIKCRVELASPGEATSCGTCPTKSIPLTHE